MPRYLLTPEAERDPDEIKRYLVNQGSPRVARYVLREIREAAYRDPERDPRRAGRAFTSGSR